MSYEIPGLDTLLNTYAENIIRSYQEKTQDIRASGALCNSVTYQVNVQGDNFEVTLLLEDYWEYIEYGRAPSKKFPPRDQILEWIRIKRILPTPYTLPNGKQQIPTENQLAYLISRKIAWDGTQPRPYLQESINENYENFSRQLIDLLGDTVLELIDNNLNYNTMYSCNYPIWHTLTSSEPYVDYNIYLKEELIYTGRVYFRSEEGNSIRIDISNICREYLETFYEQIERASTTSATSVPESGKLTTIGIFDVNSTGGNGSYPVIYDYNTDYESDLPNSGSLNDPILEEADPRQMIYISGYNYSGTTSFSYSIQEGSSGSSTLTSNLFNLYQINLDNLTALVGSILTTTCNGTEHTYKIVPSCKNRFVLYYVNKYGGLDSLLCGGRSIESFNAQQTDIHIYPDKSDSRNWGEKRVHQEIEKQYQLNTKWITESGASKIDHLIYSPKVWIHDLTKDTITSCLITNSSYTIKTVRNDNFISYEINVKESQKQIRR